MIDVVQQVNAAQRRVGGRVLEAGQARTVTIARSYETSVEDLWDAATNPERIPRWFLPVTGELELGGRYQLEGNAGGTIESCDPPHGFGATWEYGGSMGWIEVRLSAQGDARTLFELEHITPVDDGGHWDRFGPAATGVGWDLALIGLTLHLASGARWNPARSPPGARRRTVGGSSHRALRAGAMPTSPVVRTRLRRRRRRIARRRSTPSCASAPSTGRPPRIVGTSASAPALRSQSARERRAFQARSKAD